MSNIEIAKMIRELKNSGRNASDIYAAIKNNPNFGKLRDRDIKKHISSSLWADLSLDEMKWLENN